MEMEKCIFKTLIIIPDDLIFDNILPRLPVKSLLRFKCVSKSWFSYIRTPQFTKSHLLFSSSLSPHFLLKNKYDIYTLAYNNNPHDNLKQPVELEHPWDYQLQVVGSCNGLICLYLYDDSRNYFAVWNPATRQHCKIRTPIEKYFFLVNHGFGYCPTQGVDDYKIVASLSSKSWVWVFSLRTQLWNVVHYPSDYPFYGAQKKFSCRRAYLDHTLYWDVRESDRIYICSFSLIDEQFDQEAPLMIPEDEIVMSNPSLCVFKGCLSFLWQQYDHYDVFLMKKEGGLTSWEKLFSMPFILNVRFLNFAITGKCLVIHQSHIDESMLEHSRDTINEVTLPQGWSGELKLVDPTLEALEHSQGISYELSHMYQIHQYVESLVSLPPFTSM